MTPASLALRLLLQAGYDTELRDGDGWTPLHAAAHWGVEDACRLLAEHGGGMDSLTHAVRAMSDGGAGQGRKLDIIIIHPFPTQGQRPCDLADEEVMNLLEELAQKQEDVSLHSSLPLLGVSREGTVTGRTDTLSWDLPFPPGSSALLEGYEQGHLHVWRR